MKELYTWQKRILHDIIRNDDCDSGGNPFIVNKISLLDIPCGCGKGEIFCHYVNEQKYNQIFVVAPLKAHVSQNMRRLKTGKYENLKNHKFITYNSDHNNHLTADEISNLLKQHPKCVIGMTSIAIKNKSIDLESIQEQLGNVLMIFDEAHHMMTHQIEYFMFNSFQKVLLSTATPTFTIKGIISTRTRETISIKDAIESNYICDYNLYIPEFETDNEVEDVNFVNIESKIKFLIKGIKKTSCKRIIVYLKNIRECQRYYEFLTGYKHISYTETNEEINNDESDDDTDMSASSLDSANETNEIGILQKYFYDNYWIGMIHSNIKIDKREEELHNFQHNTKSVSIMLNVRILDECIDVPKCDSVFITKVIPESDIRTIQRIFRSVRLERDDDGNVMNANKMASIFLWCDTNNDMIDTLVYLKDKDTSSTFNQKVHKITIEKNDDAHHEELNASMNDSDLLDIEVDVINERIQWNNRFMTMYNDSVKRNKLISDDYITDTNEPIGQWLYKQKLLFKKGLLIEHRFQMLNNFYYFKKWLTDFHIMYNNLEYYGERDVNDVPSGYGIGVSTILKYCGQFVSGNFEGLGILKNSKDKKVYIGQFKNNTKDGYGVLFNNTNNILNTIYRGHWINNKYNGYGIEYYLNNEVKYEGFFKDGLYEGKGIYFDTKNNQKYDGHFCNGLRHGTGKLYLFRQNRVFNGQFENDKQVRGQSSSIIKNEAACCREEGVIEDKHQTSDAAEITQHVRKKQRIEWKR